MIMMMTVRIGVWYTSSVMWLGASLLNFMFFLRGLFNVFCLKIELGFRLFYQWSYLRRRKNKFFG